MFYIHVKFRTIVHGWQIQADYLAYDDFQSSVRPCLFNFHELNLI